MDHDEHIRLIKENAGLKTGYEKYKRKYKLIRNILMGHLRSTIIGLEEQYRQFTFRGTWDLQESTQVETLRALCKQNERIRKELNLILEMCREVDSI